MSERTDWRAFVDAALAWRRLELAPTLVALSSPAVPSPTLSPVSLIRLSGQEPTGQPTVTLAGRVRKTRNARSDDLGLLVRCLNKYADHDARLGERRQRAIDCAAEIQEGDVVWTPFGEWIRDWTLDELARTRDNLNGRYEVSSLATYTSTLLLAGDSAFWEGDPNEWEEEEFVAWCMQVGDKARRLDIAIKPSQDRVDDALPDRARHALAAFATGLARRHENVPHQVRHLLKVSLEKGPVGSASSTLIRPLSINAATAIMQRWYTDYPGDLAIAMTRVHVSTIVPMRSGDLSSLAMNCITPGGGLTIRRNGFCVHKTDAAIRVPQLSEAEASETRVRIDVLREYFGDAELLLRFDGSPASCARDTRIAADWSQALKLATGDPAARPHSVRAYALQERAWPGWQLIAEEMMQGQADPIRCWEWAESLTLDWVFGDNYLGRRVASHRNVT